MKKLMPVVIFTALFLYLPAVAAENINEIRFGDYTVNFNAFPSTFLQANIAKAMNIRQSGTAGVLTLAVRKKMADGSEVGVDADIRASAISLIGKSHQVNFVRFKEDHALYYIGVFPFTGNETVGFDIEVQPEGETNRKSFSFKRAF